jgi:hypothetical protein
MTDCTNSREQRIPYLTNGNVGGGDSQIAPSTDDQFDLLIEYTPNHP